MPPVTRREKTLPPKNSLAEHDATPPPKANPPSVNSTPIARLRTPYPRELMPENEQFRLGEYEYAELNSEGFSQGPKRSRKDDPEAFLGALIAANGRKKFKPYRSSSNTGTRGGSRDSESIRASGNWNLMIRSTTNGEYGVVNDFYLAAIMTPGQASPTKQGFERTETKLFMAITLLEAEPGEVIQRQWSHDLESVIWCLALYVLPGTPNWREGTYIQVGALKRTWVAHARRKGIPTEHRTDTEHLWTPLTKAALEWSQRQDLVFNGDLEYSEKTNMELNHCSLPCPKRPDGEEWDWMDLKVREEDIRKDDQAFAATG